MYRFFVEKIKWNDLRLIIKYDEMFIVVLFYLILYTGFCLIVFFLSQ